TLARFLAASCADPSTSAPSLGGRYPLHGKANSLPFGTMGRSDSRHGPALPRGRPVDARASPWRVSRVASSSLQTCRRHYPGGPVASDCSGLLTAPGRRRRRPSRYVRRVGIRMDHSRGLLGVHCRRVNPSTLLRPICLLNRLHDSLTSEASADSLPPRLFR